MIVDVAPAVFLVVSVVAAVVAARAWAVVMDRASADDVVVAGSTVTEETGDGEE